MISFDAIRKAYCGSKYCIVFSCELDRIDCACGFTVWVEMQQWDDEKC